MPIYEFYCNRCNTIYNFFSRMVNTDKIPDCPRCKGVQLKRKVSVFFTTSGRKEEGETGMPPIDETRMEKALAMLTNEAEKINEDDPRQAAQLMRRLTHTAGLPLGPGMEEALSRMERGEDIEQIEKELGDFLNGEEPFLAETPGKKTKGKPKPKVDDTLYEL